MRSSRPVRLLLGAMEIGVAPNWAGQSRGGVGPASCSSRCLATWLPALHNYRAHSNSDARVSQSALAYHGIATCSRHYDRTARSPLHTHTAARAHATAAAAVLLEDGDDPEICPGRLVEYKRDTRTGLALINKADGRRNWVATDARGVTYSLRPQQIAYVLPGMGYKVADLEAIDEQAHSILDEELLQMAWDVSEGAELYTVPQMAELLFGQAPQAAQLYVTHRLLSQDRTLFKQAGRLPPLFQPRPLKEVQMLRERADAALQAQRKLGTAAAAMQAASALPHGSKPTPEEWRRGEHAPRIAALQEFAFERATPAQLTSCAEILKAMGLHFTAAVAGEVLRATGAWGLHEQAGLLRSDLSPVFPPAFEEEAQGLITTPIPDADAHTRMDLTHLPVTTIDSASTKEIDDGLSVEHRGEGLGPRLWVHVADPSRWIPRNHMLDVEARRRAKTMYLPTGAIFMFPACLAAGPFSLRMGAPCCALSIGMVLNPDGSLAETTITPSTIKVTQRTTFVDTERLLGDEAELSRLPNLKALYQAAQLRRAWRDSKGAVSFAPDDVEVRVEDAHLPNPRVTIQPQLQSSAASMLVAEMMILAGEAVGTFGAQAGLPLPYRAQATPILPPEEQLQAIPEGRCRQVAIRSRMTRSVSVIFSPLKHGALGLDAYVQVTSPIRRYNDLLAHWQLKAHLRGDAALMPGELLGQLVDEANDNSREWGSLEKQCHNYWVALYFQQQLAGRPHRLWPALMLAWQNQQKGLAKVLLHGLGMEMIANVDRPAIPGDQLQLACTSVDVSAGMVKFSAVGEGLHGGEELLGEGMIEDGAEEGQAAHDVEHVQAGLNDDVGVRATR